MLADHQEHRKRPYANLVPRKLRELVDFATRVQAIGTPELQKAQARDSKKVASLARAMLEDAVRRDATRKMQSVLDRVSVVPSGSSDEDPTSYELEIQTADLQLGFEETVLYRTVVRRDSIRFELDCLGLREVRVEEQRASQTETNRRIRAWPARISDAFLLCLDVKRRLGAGSSASVSRLGRSWSGLVRRWVLSGGTVVLEAPGCGSLCVAASATVTSAGKTLADRGTRAPG